VDDTSALQVLQDRWCLVARAFDDWDHEYVGRWLAELAQESPPPAPTAGWRERQQAAAILSALMQAQLAIRDDAHGLALDQLAMADSQAQQLPGSAGDQVPAAHGLEWVRAELAVARCYVEVNLERVQGVAASVEAAWRAAEQAPAGFLGDRLRVRSAILYGSWLGQLRDAPNAIEWFDRAAEVAGDGELLPLGLQARGNAVSVRIEQARELARKGSAQANAAWQEVRIGLEQLLRNQARLLPYMVSLVRTSRVELSLHEGRPMEALAQAKANLAEAASSDQRCTLLHALAQAQLACGQFQAAADTVAEGMAAARTLGSLPREDELCELGADLARTMHAPEHEVRLLRRQRRLRHDMRVAEARRRARLSGVLLATERARREAAEMREREMQLAVDNLALQQHAELLSEAARRDPLTGLANRRSFDSWLADSHARVRVNGQALCLAYVDVDHFKRVNDTRGHATGDAVLKRLAGLLVEGVRAGDHVARLGGEEFAVVFARATWSQALQACDRLRAAVEQLDWRVLVNDQPVTVSVGLVNAGLFDTPAAACHEVDRRLYAAKRAGRNRVHAEPVPVAHSSKQP
jgi:diguanylate cyclase (GGDEF)-like protein